MKKVKGVRIAKGIPLDEYIVQRYTEDFNAFETEVAARRCALRELAMRKLYRFAEQLELLYAMTYGEKTLIFLQVSFHFILMIHA